MNGTIPRGARFYASQSPITGGWWVGMSWPRSKYRYGGSALVRAVDDQETAEGVAELMNARAQEADELLTHT